jgi:hypothetical protein
VKKREIRSIEVKSDKQYENEECAILGAKKQRRD